MITVRGDRWPLLEIRFEGELDDREFEAYLEEYERYFARGEQYAATFITEPHSPMTKARHAKLQTEWISKHEAQLSALCVGAAFVLPSAVMRGALRAMLWMQPLPVPYRVFGSGSEAVDWADAQLQAAGVEIPRARASG